MNIAELFENYHIKFQKIELDKESFIDSLPESIIAYLQCMGTTIKLHETAYGSAYTTLFSTKDIKQEQCEICTENGLFIIGSGLNGDLITINLKNQYIGYVFHDELWEEDYDVIEDIYVELPFGIEEFLTMAIAGEEYPIDGSMAEEYIQNKK